METREGELKKIGQVRLENAGNFSARVQFKSSADSVNWKVTEHSDDILAPDTKTINLEDARYNVQDGDHVRMDVVVLWGEETIASEEFIYERRNSNTATYRIRGTPNKPVLEYEGMLQEAIIQ